MAGGAGRPEPAGAGAEPSPGGGPARRPVPLQLVEGTADLAAGRLQLDPQVAGLGQPHGQMPETLDRLMSRSPEAWRSMATAPETVRARTDPPPPSATVRSPDTVRADRSPVTPEACTGPDTDFGLDRAAQPGQGDLAADRVRLHRGVQLADHQAG